MTTTINGAARPAPKPAAPQAAPPTPKRMTLASVASGRRVAPLRVLMYGVEGIGKTSFGADAPKPIFLAGEDGTDELDVARFPRPTSWADVLDAVGELLTGEHDYRTLVVDTLDSLEPICHAHVCRLNGWPNIAKPGYGKGEDAALAHWRELLARLADLRDKRGMNLVLLAHAQVKGFDDPEAPRYDRYVLKLHQKAAGLLKEWVDAVLFAKYQTFTQEIDGRKLGATTGARMIHTGWHAAYDAKNRLNLPETIPLSWEEFAKAAADGRASERARFHAEIEALIGRVDEATANATRAWLADNADASASKLAQMTDRLRAKAAIATETKGDQ